MTEKMTATDLAGPMLEALDRLSAVADWLEGIDLVNITDDDRKAVFAVDQAVRDAAHAVTMKARFGLRAEERHLADMLTPLFVALVGTMPVLDEIMFTDDALAGALR